MRGQKWPFWEGKILLYKPRGGVSAKTTILAEAYAREFTVIPLLAFLVDAAREVKLRRLQ